MLQIHVMAEFVQRGLETMADALLLGDGLLPAPAGGLPAPLAAGPGRGHRAPDQAGSWRSIAESPATPSSSALSPTIASGRTSRFWRGPGPTRRGYWSIAAPISCGSGGRTRGVLALAYNRHAAAAIRRRLEALIGDEARAVTVLTCHAFAMRLVGASFAGRAEPLDDDAFGT
ncbi:MAG: hypothetical protein OXG72_03510 [Acidobacteria bacterium]|nr:hypothetical protein [Acidobacteriota bacterium]